MDKRWCQCFFIHRWS